MPFRLNRSFPILCGTTQRSLFYPTRLACGDPTIFYTRSARAAILIAVRNDTKVVILPHPPCVRGPHDILYSLRSGGDTHRRAERHKGRYFTPPALRAGTPRYFILAPLGRRYSSPCGTTRGRSLQYKVLSLHRSNKNRQTTKLPPIPYTPNSLLKSSLSHLSSAICSPMSTDFQYSVSVIAPFWVRAEQIASLSL